MTIPQRILLHVAVAAVLVIAVATGVTYGIVYNGAKQRDLKHLETYVTERAKREESGFQQVQANLELVRGQFLKRLESSTSTDDETRWGQRFQLFPDGAWRSRTNFSDGRKYATMFAHKNCSLTPQLKKQVLRAQDLCDELLPTWVDTFPSVYFVFPGWLNIGFDPRIPNWVWDTPADYDATALEWFHLAMPTNRLSTESLWTGVIEEPTTRTPIVSVYVPIEMNGRFAGSIGHDLDINRLMEESGRSELPGAMHLIFRNDGRLIAHPGKRKEILASKGELRMQDSGEAALASLYHAVSPQTERRFSGYDAASGLYYSVARLAGPEWFFLTTIPREQLQRQAFDSAQWVLWSGLVSLALVLVFLATTLRRQIAHPLIELTRATKQMSGGDVNARAEIERDDEFGALAGAFNEMAARVRLRDTELQAEKASLERRVAERTAELRESENRFATTFRHSPVIQSLMRAEDGVIVEVNNTFLEKMERTREQVLGKTPLEIGSWVEPEKLLEYRDQLESKGHVLGYEAKLRANDGSILTVLISTHRVEIGGVTHYLNAGVDITQRKQAEAKLLESERQLRESEARFSTAFHASPVLMTIARLADAKFVEINEAFIRMTEWQREELIGRDSRELGLWRDVTARTNFFERIKRDGEVRDVECEIRMRHGNIRTMQLSGKVIEINREPHLITFGVDITERKRAELALRDAESQTRALYDSISAAVVVHDDTGFLQFNRASLKIFGTDRAEDILGKSPADFSAARQADGEDSASAAKRHMDHALANGVEHFEWITRRVDGVEIPVEVTLTAVQYQGRPALQAVVIDLTERKLAEAELQNALAKERELNQLKSDFVSLVSHEFRTPLEIIMSSVDNLDRYHERLPTEKRGQLLKTINKSVRRMAGMMEEVLVLGRVESGKMKFKPEQFDLPAFCRRVSDEIESATNKRCAIDLQIAAAAPLAYGDEDVLRHIFSNLLSNAVKYSQAGQTVIFTIMPDGDNAVFRVIDHGCGIPAADQARLFQAFHRGENVRQIPGTGLGLVIVQRCVQLHGGKIFCESAEGRGTTFTVSLPLFNQTTEPDSHS